MDRAEAVAGRGILGFAYQVSDDGKVAVVELVARDRRAFGPMLGAQRADVRVFERGKVDGAAVEAEIRKLIADFDLKKFGARAR